MAKRIAQLDEEVAQLEQQAKVTTQPSASE
jgi:hypothetical protein